ncbi:ArsR/SmtB family transcription factor [Varunaivibrio sulfuroxidans]|uniref:ArsR family transcriptional regulator n=1 Tax=Varunaivibrio sulfuroxidans TaxID=1773489 RepID=A0A4R3J5U6_9PROT|nr:metalloregulator ArsR/SmtB family transcription factor [Varunaivibrio sulfuroxidans]TCS60682.1 ArsR family transcriptional regulator [Varunaivibrio sulfuroxidans]WES30171.1 metalloregulator ArsR/SmtB family transcription factor [Varunaivibrio sulfuroxidans]
MTDVNSTRPAPKTALFEQLALIAKALSQPLRLELMEHLGQGERPVEALANLIGQSLANTSHHLLVLRRAGLAEARKQGVRVLYRLSGDDVVDLLNALRLTGERHNAEVERVLAGYFRTRDNMEPLSREELLRRAKGGLVTVLDVRPAGEFAAGHLPGAINIPLSDLGKRLKELPENREVVAYCRGAYCVLSFEAVAELRKKGFKARRLEEGYPEWHAAGLPVTHAPE